MRKLALTIATGALLASGVHADWVLGTYPTPTTDSAVVKTLYGPVTFANKASKVNVTVPAAGELKLTGTFLDDATGTYTANLGLIHPLTKSFEIRPITGVTAVTFDIKLDAIPTEGVGVSFSSKLYGKDATGASYNDAGKTYGYLLGETDLPTVNTWGTITIAIGDFAPPGWWPTKDIPATYPSLETILTAIEAVQIAPKTLYKTAGKGPTTATVNMSIRNLTLVGVDPRALVNPTKIGCSDKTFETLEDFVAGTNVNLKGGYWYAYSDTNSAKPLDSATGSSTANMVVTPGDELLGDAGFATFTAGLHKNVAGSPFLYRPYSGWSSIGTGFEGDGYLEGTMLTGIEFSIKALKIGDNVDGVNFKVTIPGVADAVTHFVTIPKRQFTAGSADYATSICIRPDVDLKQPSWIKPTDATPFSGDKITKFAWEAKIADEGNSAIAHDTAAFTLTNVKLHGMTEFTTLPCEGPACPSGVSKRAQGKSAFRAIYSNGVLSVNGLAGYNTLSVIAPSGKVLSSFDAKIGAKSIKLDRGTYFVVARGEAGKTLSRKIVVLK
jgi:hypothetical protein